MKTFIKVEDISGDTYNVEVDKVSHFKQTRGYGDARQTKFKMILDDGTQIQLVDKSEVTRLMTKIVSSSQGMGCGV